MAPKVSVIIPVYNAEKYLRECLDSVVNQTLKEIEIILTDDGSTDTSLSICQEYANKDDRIRLYKQKNIGAGATRNRSISLAKGEYIAFLDADDYWDLNALEFSYQKSKALDLDIFFFEALAFLDGTQDFFFFTDRRKKVPDGEVFSNISVSPLLFYRGAVWYGIYRTSFVKKIEANFDESVQNLEDNIFAIRTLLYAERMAHTDKPLIYHRRGNENSLTYNREKTSDDIIKAIKNMEKVLSSEDLFEPYKQVLESRFLLSTYYFLDSLKEPVQSFASTACLKKMFIPFEWDTKDITYWDSSYLFFYIQHLKTKNNFSEKLEKLFYSDKKKIVPVVLSINEKSVWYATVALQSLIEHANPNRFYDIYLLHTDLLKETQDRMEALSDKNIRLTCVNVKDKIPKDICKPKTNWCSKEMWYYLIPDLFYGYDKIIYMDACVLLKKDIAKLFDVPMSDKIIAASPALLTKDFEQYCQKDLNINPENYIDSDLVIFNVPAWKEKGMIQKVYQLVQKAYGYKFQSQDILNTICQDNVLYLENISEYRTLPDFVKNLIDDDGIQKQKLTGPKLIHHALQWNPWYNQKSIYAQIWYAYARKTPFYEAILYQIQSG